VKPGRRREELADPFLLLLLGLLLLLILIPILLPGLRLRLRIGDEREGRGEKTAERARVKLET
jgi:hypothetical protein